MFENIIDRIKNLFSQQENNTELINTPIEEMTKDQLLAIEGFVKYKSGINGKIPSKDKMYGDK